jgi:hypothetical protein
LTRVCTRVCARSHSSSLIRCGRVATVAKLIEQVDHAICGIRKDDANTNASTQANHYYSSERLIPTRSKTQPSPPHDGVPGQFSSATSRSGQVVALLAHTTCLKIRSTMLDCSVVGSSDTRSTKVLAQLPSCAVACARSKLDCDNKACDMKVANWQYAPTQVFD